MEIYYQNIGGERIYGNFRAFLRGISPREWMEGLLTYLQGYAKKERLIRGHGAPQPGKLTARGGSGGISGSINRKVEYSGGDVTGRLGSTLFYSKVHEFGKTITAKRAPYLRFRTHDGTWHMKKSVTIPPRPIFGPTLEENRSRVNSMFDAYVGRAKTRAGFK